MSIPSRILDVCIARLPARMLREYGAGSNYTEESS
jgi:hypothetical protein